MTTIPEALTLAHEAAAANDVDRARYIYGQILQALPDEPNAHCGLGMLAYREGQLDAAEDHLRRAIQAFPHEASFHNNLYLVLLKLRQPAEAADCCRRALEIAPAAPELHNNLGIAQKECQALDEAVASFRRAIELRPNYAEAHYNLANVLVQLHRLDEAESEYRHAAQLAPRDSDIHNNLGTLLRLLGRHAEALHCFEAALTLRPDSAEAHRNRASHRLLMGDYAEGWPEYEWRWRLPEAGAPHFFEPRWQGQPPAGRSLLVWAEQGIGDTIQFVRYAQLVKQQGARVVLDCRQTLHRLLRSVPGVDAFCDGISGREPCDWQIPLLSLPAVCGTTLETIPSPGPYLQAEPERVAYWRGALGDASALRVGIAWQGSAGFKGDYYRSIPLAEFAPLARAGAKLFSLQKGYGTEQLAALANQSGIVDLGGSLDTGPDAFVDTAAVMMHLDLVITSDTAMAHVAGALGVPTWVALPFSPNWRWLLDRDDSPWYSSLRLFRQKRFGDWTGVFDGIAAELAARVRAKPS